MNWGHFRKNNVNAIVRLHPPARFFDSGEVEMPAVDDDWRIDGFPDGNKIKLVNLRTNSVAVIAKDSFYGYAEDAHRTSERDDGNRYGFLTLKLEILIRNGFVSTRPNSRPGESVGVRIAPQWTKPIPFDLHVPLNATSAELQYKLWSQDSRIELMLRIASENGLFMKEVSGASGTLTWTALETRTVQLSFSHPRVQWGIEVLGYSF